MANAKPSRKKNDVPGIMDVSKPGRSAPSSTSKPIIITNRPILQDPMMVDEDNPGGPVSPAKAKITIQPINVTTDEDKQDANIEVIKADETPAAGEANQEEAMETTEANKTPAVEEPASQVVEKQEETTDTPEVPPPDEKKPETTQDVERGEVAAESSEAEPVKEEEESDEAKDTAKPDTTALSSEEQEAAAKKIEEEKLAHQAAIQKLVDNEQYFLPINAVENRKTKRFIALGIALIVLLAISWLDVALDAGLIKLGGIKSVTHFFARQQTVNAPTSSTPKTPTITYQNFALPVSKLSFRYPSDWKLDNTASNAQSDTVNLQPKTVLPKPPGGLNVVFLSLPIANQQTSSTIKSVHYQKLTHSIDGKTVYLVDLIYQDVAGNISLTSSLTNDNSLKVGQKTATLQQNFTNANGKANYFGITVPPTSGSSGLETIASGQSLLGSHQYQQARAILLSLTMAKS